MFPTQLPDGKPFEEGRIAFIQPGVSTKEDIEREMENFSVWIDAKEVKQSLSPKIYRSGTSWLYAQTREEFQLSIASDGGGGPMFGDTDFHFLLINFDSSDVVADYRVMKAERRCSRDRVCVGEFASGFEYQLLASDSEDQAVKQRELVPDRCDIFIFGDPRTILGNSRMSGSIRIALDGEFVGEILENEHYFFVSTGRGEHQLTLSRRFYSRSLYTDVDPTTYDFDCTGRERGFFKLKPRRGRVQVTEMSETDGWRSLNSRILTLTEDRGTLSSPPATE